MAKGSGKKTIRAAGKKPISFQPGGLHASLSVPAGKPIPAGKMRAALNGRAGPKAAAQARFAVNVLGTKKPSGVKKGARRGK